MDRSGQKNVRFTFRKDFVTLYKQKSVDGAKKNSGFKNRGEEYGK